MAARYSRKRVDGGKRHGDGDVVRANRDTRTPQSESPEEGLLSRILMKKLVIVALFSVVMFAGAPRSNAGPLVFVAFLSGPNESPANNSPGTGFATVTIDAIAHTMLVEVTFQDLVAPNTASHIHAATAVPFTGTAGVATTTPTFTGFPTGTQSGTYTHLFDMTLASSYNPAFVTAHRGSIAASQDALFSAIMTGNAYLNIHSTVFTRGEIRGFLVPTPEPATMLLFGTGIASIALKIRRRRKIGVSR